MKKLKIEKIDDIYPLTIFIMKYGGKIIILNSESLNSKIIEIQFDENPSYDLEEWMVKNISPIHYGIGYDITDAFEDYKKRYYES